MRQTSGLETGSAAQRERLRTASSELAFSLWRLGLAIATSPLRLLPTETREHLRAARHEADRAGVALGRGLVPVSRQMVDDWEAQLDELEERVARIEQAARGRSQTR
jgi:hypothetical protein